MKVCRACGQNWCKFEDGQSESINKYANIYFHLTSVQLLDCIEQDLVFFCTDCITKLEEFDLFRQNCLDVHQRLQQVKVEVWQEDDPVGEICVKVETLPEPLVEEEESSFRKDEHEYNDFNTDVLPPIDTNISDASDDQAKDSATEQPKKVAKIANRKSTKQGTLRNSETKKPIAFLSCNLCPRKFIAQHTLDAHLRIHQGLKPFLCEVCGRDFRSLRHKKAHLVQHTDGYTRLTCDYPGCGQTLVNKLGLQVHWARFHEPNSKNHDRTTVMCDTCGKSFTSNGGLKRHKYIHNPDEMPFACDICGKKFTTKHKLQMHTSRHAGIKNFVCSICGLRKTSKDELRNHIRIVHEKQKRNDKTPCDLCGIVFSQKAALKRHVNVVHLGIKQHVCTICEAAFGQREHLKRHMQSHAGRNTTDDTLTV